MQGERQSSQDDQFVINDRRGGQAFCRPAVCEVFVDLPDGWIDIGCGGRRDHGPDVERAADRPCGQAAEGQSDEYRQEGAPQLHVSA